MDMKCVYIQIQDQTVGIVDTWKKFVLCFRSEPQHGLKGRLSTQMINYQIKFKKQNQANILLIREQRGMVTVYHNYSTVGLK